MKKEQERESKRKALEHKRQTKLAVKKAEDRAYVKFEKMEDEEIATTAWLKKEKRFDFKRSKNKEDDNTYEGKLMQLDT